jgi:hypothetical protein
LREFPLARFAAQFWIRYAGAIQDHEKNVLESLILELLNPRNECFANWVRICDPDTPSKPPDYRKPLEDIAPPLYYASLSGSLGITKLLLNNGADGNAFGGKQGDALHAAAFRGHEAVVRLLLDNKLVIDRQIRTFGTVLQAAAAEGHEAVVRLLLENGADVNAQGREHDTTLVAVVKSGNETLLRMLLENGGDVNAQSRGKHYALETAAGLYGGR